ncbi:unnamed protein product [Albugo candida]|nr:unnamed protein product [Albugo candida]|eukprot:CCI43580.1 unnamed protein product [Albugo candida]
MKEIKNGTFDPANCKIPGYKTPEQQERDEAERKRRELERKKREHEGKEKMKAEEKEIWWNRARLRASGSVEEGEGLEREHDKNRIVCSYKEKDANDYSIWDHWKPHDPASMEEEKEKEDCRTKLENEAFERNNSQFCDQFKKDLNKRQKSEREKQKSSQKWKAEGNAFYKRKQYEQAIDMYMKAIRETPFIAAILFNVALCHFRLDQMDDSIEFSSRAIFIDPQHVKALSRRAAAKYKQNRLQEAVDDLKIAVRIEKSNPDLLEQYSSIVGEYEDTLLHAKLVKKYNLNESNTVEDSTADTLINLQAATGSAILRLRSLLKLIRDAPDNEIDLKEGYELIATILSRDTDARLWFRTSNNLSQFCQDLVSHLQAHDRCLSINQIVGLERQAKIISSSFEILEACCRQSPRNQLIVFQQACFPEAINDVIVSWSRENCTKKDVLESALCFLDTAITLQSWKRHVIRSPQVLTSFLFLLNNSKPRSFHYICSLCFTVSDSAQGIQAFVGLPESIYMTAIYAAGAYIADRISTMTSTTNTMLDLLGFLVNLTTNSYIQTRISQQVEENRVLVTQLVETASAGATIATSCMNKVGWSTLLERVFATLLNLTFQDDSYCRKVLMSARGTVPVTQLIKISLAHELDWVLNHATLISYCVSILCRHHQCAKDYDGYDEMCFQMLGPLIQLHRHLSSCIKSNDGNYDGALLQLFSQVWCHIGWIIKQQSSLCARLLCYKEIVPSIVSVLHYYVDKKSGLHGKFNAASERLIGNILAVMITLVTHTETSQTILSALSKPFNLEILVKILQLLSNGLARKNVAVLLAKLCQHSSQVKDQIRSLRGLEMMLSIHQSDGFQ